METLEFLRTLTIEQFKDEQKVPYIEVLQNPNSSKIFFTYGSKTGACSSKGVPKDPRISLVKGETTEKNPDGKFWLLHEAGKGGAVCLATFGKEESRD